MVGASIRPGTVSAKESWHFLPSLLLSSTHKVRWLNLCIPTGCQRGSKNWWPVQTPKWTSAKRWMWTGVEWHASICWQGTGEGEKRLKKQLESYLYKLQGQGFCHYLPKVAQIFFSLQLSFPSWQKVCRPLVAAIYFIYTSYKLKFLPKF